MRSAVRRGLVAALIVSTVACGDDGAAPVTSSTESTAPPVVTRPDATEPDATEPDGTEPDATQPDAPPASRESIPLVVDTDLAIDDLVALAFLLSSDAVDVRAITVSGTGEVRCPTGIGVVRELLARTASGAVPVACGRSAPLAGAHQFPAPWRDAADSGWGVLDPTGTPVDDEIGAEALLIEQVEPGVSLLALGPLTDVADALRADPELATRVASIVIMGGAVDAAGNVTDPALDAAASEWNVYVDPTAAEQVLGSGAPVLLVPLDATEHVPVTPVFLERLAVNSQTTAATLVADLYAANPLTASGDAYFWDPLAAAVIVDPGLATTERAELTVVTGDGPDSGRTIRREGGHPIEVAVAADGAGLEELLLRTLAAVAPDEQLVEPPPPVGEAVVAYDGTACTYDGPVAVAGGRMVFTFESVDPAWVAAVAHLTGELTIDEVVAQIADDPEAVEAPRGVDEVVVVPPGAGTFVSVRSPAAGVVCSTLEPGPILVATTITVE